MAFQLLKTLGHQHGILAAGNTDGDPVALLDQLVIVDGFGKFTPDGFAELFLETLLHVPGKILGHILFHVIEQPRSEASLETVRIVAICLQLIRHIHRNPATAAADDLLLFLIQSRCIQNMILICMDRPRNLTRSHLLRAPDIQDLISVRV